MSPANARSSLAALTETLLDEGSGPLEQRDAAQGLYDLCSQLAGAPASEESLALPHGIALAPAWAARCLLDFARSACFLRGVRAAIQAATARFGSPVRVLYAGCGPFAPLCLPLTTQLAAGSACFTLLDVQPEATASARRLIEAFEAQDWIEDLETTDALRWQAPRPPHVIVVEAMQKGLSREPQFALTRHLAPQLAPGGFFIPEEIRLSACLGDLAREFGAGERVRLNLGDVLVLRGDPGWHPAPSQAPLQVAVPAHAGSLLSLLLLTHVRALGPHQLKDYDSGISYPTVLHSIGRVEPGARLELRYHDGRDPGVAVSLLG